MTNKFQPNWSISPGDSIQKLLELKNISLDDFAYSIGEKPSMVDSLINNSCQIDETVAQTLSVTLGSSPAYWLNISKVYNEWSKSRIDADKDLWLKDLPLNFMESNGWVDSKTDRYEECLKFFDIKSVGEFKNKYDQLHNEFAFRKSSAFSEEFGATIAWLRKGEIEANKQVTTKWDPEQVTKKLDDLKQISRVKSPKQFIPRLTSLCNALGISLVILRAPKGCRASGASKFISNSKAMILLSFRYLTDDQFWFTFFHELGHLVMHPEVALFLEANSEVQNDFELEANLFAGELLVPSEFYPVLKKTRGKKSILKLAQELGISPGILVGQMQFAGITKPSYYNHYKRRYNWDEINQTS
ncbi:MAG: ImmA/IrrE family metallo-endopeptidase [Bacteroidota bacterium]